MSTFALEEARTNAGMSRRELARAADVSESTVIRIERHRDYEPGLFSAMRIAHALGKTISDLIHETDCTTHGVPRGKHHGPPDDVLADNEGPDMHIGE